MLRIEFSITKQHKRIRKRAVDEQKNAAIMIKFTSLEDIESEKTQKQSRYLKTNFFARRASKEINQTIKESIENKSNLGVDISEFAKFRVTEKSIKKTLKDMRCFQRRPKKSFREPHKIKRKYLRLYLHEFICKLKQKNF